MRWVTWPICSSSNALTSPQSYEGVDDHPKLTHRGCGRKLGLVKQRFPGFYGVRQRLDLDGCIADMGASLLVLLNGLRLLGKGKST